MPAGVTFRARLRIAVAVSAGGALHDLPVELRTRINVEFHGDPADGVFEALPDLVVRPAFRAASRQLQAAAVVAGDPFCRVRYESRERRVFGGREPALSPTTETSQSGSTRRTTACTP